MSTTYLLRFGELTLKTPPVRKRMVGKMIHNLKDGLRRKGIEATIQQTWARVFVTTQQPEALEGVLSNLFGLRSFSPIERRRYSGLNDLLDQAEEYFAPDVEGVRFEARSRREKKIPLSTQEIERELGARLMAHGGIVDLTTPALTCSIELRGTEAFFFAKNLPSPGGLPLGTEQFTLSLLSGGFDSPVATWLAMRRGAPCDFVFFELGGLAQRGAIYALLQHLYREWCFGYEPRLFVVPGEPILDAIHEQIPQKLWNVMLKRIFYRVAERIAHSRKYAALVTGEAIAQVSSQTLSNLGSISHGLEVPILRPVLTAEKLEIIDWSRKIGTHDISAQVQEYCAITPKKPATRSNPEQVQQWEQALGGDDFYAGLEAQAEELRVADVDPAQVRYLEALIDRVPPRSIWIDMREERDAPPLPREALKLTLEALVLEPEVLSKDESYLLLCDIGTQSAEAAFMLQELGYQAHAYQGGLSRLKKKTDLFSMAAPGAPSQASE